jgi:flagellar basal-body rod protein FlgC
MDMMRALVVAGEGLKAQAARMRLISENIANSDSTSESPGGDPYRRKIPVFRAVVDRELGATSVKVSSVRRDQAPFESRLDPGNPAADAQGFVKYPNVNTLIEQADMREAQRSYEANLNIITATRRMITRTIDILRA